MMCCCCCYRKGTNFQANHNYGLLLRRYDGVVVATAKVRIFKQITTSEWESVPWTMLLLLPQRYEFSSKSQRHVTCFLFSLRCCCYRKGTNFQANHNRKQRSWIILYVVVATAKVRIFKQITTKEHMKHSEESLLLLPQRYEFSSKSQLLSDRAAAEKVVVATAKVRILGSVVKPSCIPSPLMHIIS